MARVTLSELADGAAALDADALGRPTVPGVVVDLDTNDWARADDVIAALKRPSTVVLGVSRRALPEWSARVIESMTVTLAPGGPGRAWAGSIDDLAAIEQTLQSAPVAAITLAGVLQAGSRSGVEEALVLESCAYSTLLAGSEFRDWREATLAREAELVDQPVLISRDGDELTVTLDHPSRRNAFGHAMRDGLVAALKLAELDSSVTVVRLRGNGPSFSSGGDLAEFGTAGDPAAAHLIRLQQSAGLAVHRIATRVEARLHGACIGAGIEVPAFAGRVLARDDAWFQLPELGMGLIPGAGGTVSIPRRIGRWRAAYLALTRRAIDIDSAIAWGLVDERY